MYSSDFPLTAKHVNSKSNPNPSPTIVLRTKKKKTLERKIKQKIELFFHGIAEAFISNPNPGPC